MAGSKPAYIAADVYSVSKQFNRGLTVGIPPLVFKDSDGNIVLTAQGKGGNGSSGTGGGLFQTGDGPDMKSFVK